MPTDIDGARLAWWDGEADRLVIDGEAVDALPRGRVMRGQRVYTLGPIPWSAMDRRYLSPGDRVGGVRPGEVASATIKCASGHYAVRDGAGAWGLSPDPATAEGELLTLRAELIDARIAPHVASAAAMSRVVERRSMPEEHLKPLPPRFRPLAWAACMGPPMSHVSSCDYPQGVEWDLRAAYLRAMLMKVPIPGTWRPLRYGVTWQQIRLYNGIIRAVVFMPQYDGLAPLPISHPKAPIMQADAHGWLTGAWPLWLLRWAEETHGAKVAIVLDGALCDVAPILRPIVRSTLRLPPTLRKLSYTRTVGRWQSTGWYDGADHAGGEVPEGASVYRGPHGPRVWAPSMGPWWQGRGVRDVHPEWAAWVMSETRRRLVEAAMMAPVGSLALAHVDAVWVGDADWFPPDPGRRTWAAKARGPLRAYAVGTYRCGGKVRAQGREGSKEGHVTAEELDRASWPKDGGARVWDGDRSAPMLLRSPPEIELVAPSWDAEPWTASGYLREGRHPRKLRAPWPGRPIDVRSGEEEALPMPHHRRPGIQRAPGARLPEGGDEDEG